MTHFELLVLAISLTFDTFAVSVGGGISMPNMKLSRKAMVIAFFGVFQAAYLFAGWFLGDQAASFIVEWDHWVAFVILTYLGGKMFLGAIKGDDSSESGEGASKLDFLCIKRLAVLATATSIDAIAVGASLAMLDIDMMHIGFTTLYTFVATAVAAYIGLQGGSKLGHKAGKKAEIWGGVILIVIGMKILIEHVITF
jgi:putative Mn2+ efflux pump MntP